MSETRKKRESIIICSVVIVSYIAMYVLTLMYENAISPGIMFDHVFRINIESMITAVLLAIIPYEKLNYIWHKDLVGYWFGIKSNNIERTMLIEAAILYIIFWLSNFGLRSFFYFFVLKNTNLIIFIISIVMVWILINCFKLIKSNISLFVVSHLFIMVNGLNIFRMTNRFYITALVTISLVLGWNVCNFMSDRKYKLLSLLISVICSTELINIAIDITGKYRAFDAWLNPNKERNLIYSRELRALNQHVLKLPDDLPWYKQYDHPFIAINTYLGIGALIVMFIVFIVITIAYIRSRKILSENRFKLTTFIYVMFAVVYVYTLSADLGFVPTATGVSLLLEKIHIVTIGIIIRLFIRREVPASTIEAFDYYQEIYQADDNFELELLREIEQIKIMQYKNSSYMLQYISFLTHKINIIEKNLNRIYEKLGDEMILENNDGYDEAVKNYNGKPIQDVVELQKKILDLYD